MTNDLHLPLHLPLHEALGITRPAVFATVGGGGKTTVLFALAAEWEAAGGESLTVLATTTKMTIPREGRALPLAIGRDAAARAGALDNIRRRGLSSAVVGSGRGDRGRVLGVDPAWPRQAVDAGLASLVGVEADGSKGRPFKAPRHPRAGVARERGCCGRCDRRRGVGEAAGREVSASTGVGGSGRRSRDWG